MHLERPLEIRLMGHLFKSKLYSIILGKEIYKLKWHLEETLT